MGILTNLAFFRVHIVEEITTIDPTSRNRITFSRPSLALPDVGRLAALQPQKSSTMFAHRHSKSDP